MATVEEAVGAKTPLGSDLAAGVESLSLKQTIEFTLYVRIVLPVDGYVFWVRSDLLTAAAITASVPVDDRVAVSQLQPSFTAAGSLHYATDVRQEEQETYAANRVVFTAEQEVNNLSDAAPNTMWIGSFDGQRFGFSSRGSFYEQAGLFHYVGFAVYADMATQIIDSPLQFSTAAVVSNSLPAWLALNTYRPFYGFSTDGIVIYPSFLVPSNLEPPFASVHIDPGQTLALAASPGLGPNSSHYQLCSDKVRITLWGTRNTDALDFVDAINQYSTDVEIIGIMNVPVMRDEKRTQAELTTIAMKKVIDYEVSYIQKRVNDVTRQLLLRSLVAWDPESL